MDMWRGGSDSIWVLKALEAVAYLAAACGETQRALRLSGCVEDALCRLKMTDTKDIVEWSNRQMAPARAAVGEAELERLAAEGRAMSLERAADYGRETMRVIRRWVGGP